MEFVGDKTEIYESDLPPFGVFPALNVADFQANYHWLENESEASILAQLRVSRLMVNSQLLSLNSYRSLEAYSMQTFGDGQTAISLYQQAVFAYCSSQLLGIQISSDTTSEAAERQEALSLKLDHCLVQYRDAIDLLLNGRKTTSFEVI